MFTNRLTTERPVKCSWQPKAKFGAICGIVTFGLLSFGIYEHGLETIRDQELHLQSQLEELRAEKAKTLEVKKELLRQINSQSDPAWIELVLIRVLGVVPERQTKVYFRNP